MIVITLDKAMWTKLCGPNPFLEITAAKCLPSVWPASPYQRVSVPRRVEENSQRCLLLTRHTQRKAPVEKTSHSGGLSEPVPALTSTALSAVTAVHINTLRDAERHRHTLWPPLTCIQTSWHLSCKSLCFFKVHLCYYHLLIYFSLCCTVTASHNLNTSGRQNPMQVLQL